MRRHGRLSRKYLVILVGLVTGALLASGAVEIYSSYNENKAGLVALQQEKASGAASRIESFVREIERQLVWTTQPLLVPTPAAAIEQRRIDAVRLQRQVLAITEVSHLDAGGREQLRVSRLAMNVIGSQVDYSGDPKFLVPKSGRTYFGPVYFRKESEPYMTIAMPQAGGGVTVAEVNLKFIWDVVSQIKVGKAGLAYVVDGGGELIAHPDISLVLQKTSLAGLEQVKAVLADVPGAAPVTIARDLKGREVLTAHSVIAPLGWVVLVEQPLEEAFATLRESAYRTAFLVALGIALSVVAGALLARRLVQPIQALQTSAAKIGAGELDHQITIHTGDELEALADEFNRMTARLRESYATLEQKVEDRTRELSEALEQQTATAEILSVISSSPTDVRPVLDTVVNAAARACRTPNVLLLRLDGDVMRGAAKTGPFGDHVAAIAGGLEALEVLVNPHSVSGRAASERRAIHVHDLLAEPESEFPVGRDLARRFGHRTILATPLLREGVSLGVLALFRTEVDPFSDKQIALLQTFADQAVIAIENVRLFTELGARNAALTEALDQQTATAEILRVISSSPTDLEPVMKALVQSAARLCEAQNAQIFRVEGDQMRLVARYGPVRSTLEAGQARPLTRGSVSGRAIVDRTILHIADLLEETTREYPDIAPAIHRESIRTTVGIPLLREGVPIGSITAFRTEVRPFSETQIALLQTFADQAVIAIENVRLFTELEEKNRTITEALDQQTATAEILRVISSSPTDVQPVFDTIVQRAVRLLDGLTALVIRVAGNELHLAALTSTTAVESEAQDALVRENFPIPLTASGVTTHVVQTRRPYTIADTDTDPLVTERIRRAAPRRGYRSMLFMPMVRDERVIGLIVVTRRRPGAFSDDEVGLLGTFADQAVIAIENVRLFKELQERNTDLTTTLEQQTATSEILRVISSAQQDVQPVFDTIVRSAVRLCSATTAAVFRVDGGMIEEPANYGGPADLLALTRARYPRPVDMESTPGVAIVTRSIVQYPDTEAPAALEFVRQTGRLLGVRSVVTLPLMRETEAVGAIVVTRREPGRFSDTEVELLKTFADQAVIAIENVRLFTELETRNAALTEALDQQTATAEILRVISSSPTDVRPVLDAVAESAARLCGANDVFIMRIEGGLMRPAAHFGDVPTLTSPTEGRPVVPQLVGGRAALERRTIHIHDARDETVREMFPETYALYERVGMRTVLATPLLREDTVVGVIIIRRLEVRPFSDKQIALLKTFADQAVIAIENVRLFTELEQKNRTISEALDQQTATAEILRVISSSPTDVQPVLDAVAENATRVCEAGDGAVLLIEGRAFRIAAHYGAIDMPRDETIPIVPGTVAGRAVLGAAPVHVEDLLAAGDDFPEGRALGQRFGNRTTLATPLLREGTPIGALLIRRTEVRPFTDKQIALLQTFADQAVIAIENVRLFQELETRTAELTRSVGELEALGEVGRAISSTLDLPTVLATIVARANELAGADGGVIYEFDEASRSFHLRATDRFPEDFVTALRTTRLVHGEGAAGRAVATRAPVQVPDILEAEGYSSGLREVLVRSGYRSLLAVPLVSEDEVVGALVINRRAPGAFPDRTVELLRTFATQSALAIQNARLFRELEDKSRELEVANQHKDEFLASMSHELRTPLNAIIGFSEVMLERMFGEVNAKQEEYLNDILSSGRHLLSLINDILDLAKIEAGRMELEPADFHLPQAIDNALILVRERAMRRGITLERSIDPRLGEVKGDERKVKQVLLNLLSNAVKFTPEGGRIDVRARLADGFAHIAVADTGVGIAPEDHEAVFEEFRQVGTDYARKHEGTGLGLALARKFVELHGGKIWLESQVGQGSTFTFTIPVTPWQAS